MKKALKIILLSVGCLCLIVAVLIDRYFFDKVEMQEAYESGFAAASKQDEKAVDEPKIEEVKTGE